MSGVPRHVLLVAFSFLLVLLRFSSDGGGATCSGFVVPYSSGSGRGAPTAHQRATRKVHQYRTRAAYRRLQVLSLAPRAQKAAVEGAQRVGSSFGAGLSGKEAVDQAGERLIPLFAEVDAHTKRTLRRVLDTFREFRVGSNVFAGVDGYGHGDIGRETLDKVYARLFGAEAALVRVQCFSGTHAIACALFGVLRPGDTMLACSGRPYDTLDEVIGTRIPMNDEYADASDPLPEGLIGNLKEFHVSYTEARWAERGLVVFVDNCYGEFVEEKEPCHVGADLIAGSLIKNPGGTIAKSGGYVAGKRRLVRAAANRLGAPGVAGGATLGQNQNLFQGLFLAPTIVGESLKGAILLAEVFGGTFGLPTNPPPPPPPVFDDTAADVNGDARGATAAAAGGGGSVGAELGGGGAGGRTDIVQALELGDRDRLIKFCEAVQLFSPVNAYVRPVPGVTPGYGDEVIFADGTFVDGSTLELSSDGPLRPPYIVFAQGCTHWTHWALIIEQALLAMGLVEE
ncbi:aluminium resistance family protein [Ectocarpus siliculosus]|uniref:Aluminium resistance family protein n=1 Tax=Ectocarpus siliculosus TaxID=2880 RepID=D7FTG7_ECTSI|nr:aluminium resistance family protein [Ectocarpus siliculosus]|eukprot:CBJ48545.1 aluminium resistance family protein [Ectocarpus siliculosus]